LDDYENSEYIKVYINNYLSSINTIAAAAAGDKAVFDRLLADFDQMEIKVTHTEAVTVDKETMAENSGFINSVGFFLMFIFAITLMISYMVLDDRLGGVYKRIQATPVKPLQYIIGTGLFGVFLCLIMVVLYCSYIFIMDINIGVPIHLLFLLMGLFSIFTVCFSLAIAVILVSKNAMTSIVIGFSTVGCILGGAYFPLDMAPESMQKLARILPQFWFMDALRSLQSDINANIYPNITIIALFSILALLLGAVSFAQNYKTN
jgi:ABC-2 type transport system permease protein